jgi:Polyketide cyclase / dehydrase and lipid transport
MGRWEAQESREVAAPPAAIWALWEDPERWADWNPAIAGAELQGPFEIGTPAIIRFRGRPAMTFDITAIEPGALFVDQTRLPGAHMGHEHRLEQPGTETVVVSHRIYFDGPLAFLWGVLMGRRIRRDLESFLDHEERLARQG